MSTPDACEQPLETVSNPSRQGCWSQSLSDGLKRGEVNDEVREDER